MKPCVQMFQEDVSLLPFITTEIKVTLETLMRRLVKGRDIEATDTVIKIAKGNALQTAYHVAASEIDVGYGATSTLMPAIKEKKFSPLQVFEFKKNVVKCYQLLKTK